MRFISLLVLGKRIGAIGQMMKDKSVSFWKKLLIVFGIVYLISPIDIIPAPVFMFAWVDDFILWIWILWYLRDELDKYCKIEKSENLSKKFYGKNIVEGVEYEVEETDDEKDSGDDN